MKVSLEGYGCTQNMGETQRYRQALSSLEGVQVVNTPEEAQICLVGTCVVIETTQNRMFKRIGELTDADKKVVVTGCLPRVLENELLERFPDVKVFGFTDTDEMVDWITGLEKKWSKAPSEYPGASNPKTAIIPISQGCLGACAYCITKLARGSLRSYDPIDIKEYARGLILDGYKELLVTAQDTAAYGFDRKDRKLPGLVRSITAFEPTDGKDYRIRIGMMNPDGALRILDDLIEVYQEPRVFRFLHIPVQSGDDEILKRMRRRYTVKQFGELILKIRRAVPDISISTDIIVGFPGETEEKFHRSMELIKELEPDILNITRFSPRPGTEAFDMEEQVHGRINKEWSRRLTKLRKEIGERKNREYIGNKVKALVTERGNDDTLITRMDNYKTAVVDIAVDVDVGDWVDVEITGATDIYLTGRIISAL